MRSGEADGSRAGPELARGAWEKDDGKGGKEDIEGNEERGRKFVPRQTLEVKLGEGEVR